MRLVCPKCAAQYEVNDSAIPATGRDVQCASCGNTWFQDHPEGHAASPETHDHRHEMREDASASDEKPGEPTHSTRPADRAVTDIIRDEAEREQKIRERENGSTDPAEVRETAKPGSDDETEETDETAPIPVPADAGTDDGPPAIPGLGAAARRSGDELREIVRRRQEDDDHVRERRPEADDMQPAPRPAEVHDEPRIPDHAELVQTLGPTGDASRARNEESVGPAPRRGAQRAGFYLAILIALILLAIYALASQIAGAIPDAAPYLERYVSVVDQLRHGVANLFATLIKFVRNLLAQYL